MKVTRETLVVTRHEAAMRQVEAAIAALEEGHFDIAITLAGAAEGMFDFRDATFEGLASQTRRLEEFGDRKKWTAVLNLERDWLKHSGDKAPELSIDDFSAGYMIARACSKMTEWTPRMVDFMGWFMGRLEQQSGA